MNDLVTPYYALDPDTVLAAIDTVGFVTDGRLLALNSYENRVYQVGIEDDTPLVAKFYRPGRWSDEQILEEHAFSLEIAGAEVPLVPPLVLDGQSLFHHQGFRFALFARRGGHAPELDQKDTRLWLGRFLGRLHAVGAVRPFEYRPALTPERYGDESLETILGGRALPAHLVEAFETLSSHLMDAVRNAWDRAGGVRSIRLHGDCHPGNILWREGPFFVDMDDCQSGPAIQDLWMLLAGDRDERSAQLAELLSGYTEFCDFDAREIALIEALRTLR
ncbi:MAG: serine/threonine protein kinase, partial [Xanthomonadales bacterium]|nr:serine/threonine protein kinase [Xanthomonadales bacterium]